MRESKAQLDCAIIYHRSLRPETTLQRTNIEASVANTWCVAVTPCPPLVEKNVREDGRSEKDHDAGGIHAGLGEVFDIAEQEVGGDVERGGSGTDGDRFEEVQYHVRPFCSQLLMNSCDGAGRRTFPPAKTPSSDRVGRFRLPCPAQEEMRLPVGTPSGG